MIEQQLKNIIKEIEQENNINLTNIREHIETIPDGKKETLIKYLQDINDKLYKDYGVTGGILNLQVYINEKRHEYNITDEKEIINTDDGMDFVQ